jgi:DNA polymerase-1
MKKLAIVDISSFIFRAFYAIRPLHAPDGTPTNAVYGVYNMLYKLLSEFQPTHVFLAKDSKEDTFRHVIYEEYKANRDEPPEDLIPQFELIHELIEKMHFKNVARPSFEADDVIGSAVVQWKHDFDEVLIISSDKDLMQFVDGKKVFMVDTMKDLKIGPKEVFAKLNVRPDQVVDYLSIVGDSSDNIPGMKGIGAVGAAKLLEEYGTLENIIKHKDKLTGKKLINAFENHLDDAILSKKLVTLTTDLDLKMTPKDTKYEFFPDQELMDFLKDRLGFKTASKKLEDLVFDTQKVKAKDAEFEISNHRVSTGHFKYKKVESKSELVKLLKENKVVAFHTEYDSKDFFENQISAIAFSFDGKFAYYLPGDKNLDTVLDALYDDERKEIIGNHFKRDLRYRLRDDLDIKSKIFDLTQTHYVLEPDGNHDFDYICTKYLDYTLMEMGKKDPPISEWDEQKALTYLGERAICNFLLAEKFKSELLNKDLDSVYSKVDRPMIKILAQMELNGILLNQEYLKELEEEFQGQIFLLEKAIEDSVHLVGKKMPKDFNLRSPKQVGDLLFETLNLPIIKTTKTGLSTDSSVLEELDARKLSDVPGLILMYRELDKLLGTYVKALPLLVHPKTHRLHTTFSLNTAATGRLSSINPNLQNIPVRSENGKKIRKAFIASKGHLLLSADYSQVELRLLAHFSKDPTMLEGFKKGIDIHDQTASEIMGIKIGDVKSEDRSKAKAVNFGLMYGQSSFGLAAATKITRGEAKEYINRYFEKFGKIKGYLDKLKETASTHGYSTTLHGRKRFLPDLKSHNRTVKSAAERLAVNSPIQGTAADILKLAMIKIDQEMRERKLKSKMLLQVHDELIFEVPESELNTMKKLVRDGMENVVKLEVPLKVEMGVGVNWLDLK